MQVNARELLVRNKTLGVDSLVDLILTDGSREQTLFQEALQIKSSKLKKTYVEACLLASTDLEEISDILEIDLELLAFYSDVFFDVKDLDRLSKMELLEVSDRQEQLLKIWALNQGLDFIAWRLGKSTKISPIDGLQELFSTSMYKAKEACFSGNASEESKEAVKWTKLSMDLARLIKFYISDDGQAQKDLRLALSEVSSAFPGFDDLKD